MEIFIFWTSFSIIAGVIAKHKGRSGIGFFLLAVILSPLIGVIAALVAEPNVARVEQDDIRLGRSKRCPFCSEIIKREARVCRYCGRELGPAQTEITNLRGIANSVVAQSKGMNLRSVANSAISDFKMLAEIASKESRRNTKCPYCAAIIEREAGICRGCGRQLHLNEYAKSRTRQGD